MAAACSWTEISEASPALQVKLLKALQDRRITRVGGTKERSADFRLITATNANLEQRVESGRFRLDLYYRLNVIPIVIPPLRQRQEDIPALIDHIWARLNRRSGTEKTLDPALKGYLQNYHWPGNVRELENILERLLLAEPGPTVQAGEMTLALVPNIVTSLAPPPPLPSRDGMKSLPQALAELEREMLLDAKRTCRSTYEMAARLGISQPSVCRKLKKLGL